MTVLWKIDAIHDRYQGTVCRLFRSEQDAAIAAVPLAMHGWWLDVERLAWPSLDPESLERAVAGTWPVCDPEQLLDLVTGPPRLERDVALACLAFETEGPLTPALSPEYRGEGDAKATEMLFKHLLATDKPPQHLVQNNYYGDGEDKALKRRGRKRTHGDASPERLSVLRARAESGEELFDDAEDPA
jgi:hypothetical protein